MVCKVIVLFVAFFALSNAHDFYGDRIIGGDIAPPNFAPYAVSLRTGLLVKSHFCGGSLISTQHILTAAHCVDGVWTGNQLSRNLEVLAGTQKQNSGGVIWKVSRNITHPEWNAKAIKNDISILELEKEIELSEQIQVIPINRAYIGGDVLLTGVGWGLTRYPGVILSNDLKYLVTPSLSHIKCVEMRDELSQTTPNYPLISQGEICTLHSIGQAMCQGDSGSALSDAYGLVGIVSWGLPCAKGAPDVFTRVSAYIDWIESAMQQS